MSLDCYLCRRCWRTVVLDSAKEGQCSSNHPFPGRVVHQTPSPTGSCYELAWQLEPFVAAKYPEARFPDGRITWARVNFEVTCGACGQTGMHSVQENLSDHTQDCDCGAVLYGASRKGCVSRKFEEHMMARLLNSATGASSRWDLHPHDLSVTSPPSV